MSGNLENDADRKRPDKLDKREALKKIGRYAAYTAPATLVALGYATSQAGDQGPPVSNGGSPPPFSPPIFSPPPPSPQES